MQRQTDTREQISGQRERFRGTEAERWREADTQPDKDRERGREIKR